MLFFVVFCCIYVCCYVSCILLLGFVQLQYEGTARTILVDATNNKCAKCRRKELWKTVWQKRHKDFIIHYFFYLKCHFQYHIDESQSCYNIVTSRLQPTWWQGCYNLFLATLYVRKLLLPCHHPETAVSKCQMYYNSVFSSCYILFPFRNFSNDTQSVCVCCFFWAHLMIWVSLLL